MPAKAGIHGGFTRAGIQCGSPWHILHAVGSTTEKAHGWKGPQPWLPGVILIPQSREKNPCIWVLRKGNTETLLPRLRDQGDSIGTLADIKKRCLMP